MHLFHPTVFHLTHQSQTRDTRQNQRLLATSWAKTQETRDMARSRTRTHLLQTLARKRMRAAHIDPPTSGSAPTHALINHKTQKTQPKQGGTTIFAKSNHFFSPNYQLCTRRGATTFPSPPPPPTPTPSFLSLSDIVRFPCFFGLQRPPPALPPSPGKSDCPTETTTATTKEMLKLRPPPVPLGAPRGEEKRQQEDETTSAILAQPRTTTRERRSRPRLSAFLFSTVPPVFCIYTHAATAE